MILTVRIFAPVLNALRIADVRTKRIKGVFFNDIGSALPVDGQANSTGQMQDNATCKHDVYAQDKTGREVSVMIT